MKKKAKPTIDGRRVTLPRRDGGSLDILYYTAPRSNAPLLLDVHGGGFISGHSESDDVLSTLLRVRSDVNVASVEYRYAPEVEYPVATEDCVDAINALCEDSTFDFNRDQLLLIGHSAGGNIVAGISILMMGKRTIAGQILDYPLLDVKIAPNKRTPVIFSIPPSMMRRFNDCYFPNHSTRGEATASPVYMSEEQARNMPQTMVLTCSLDSLREDGIRYVALLREHGVSVKHIEMQGAVHGVTEMVASGEVDHCWWLGKRRILRQKQLFEQAVSEICLFIQSACRGNISEE